MELSVRNSQGTWPVKVMHPALQTCAHQVILIFTVTKNGAPGRYTQFKIVHPPRYARQVLLSTVSRAGCTLKVRAARRDSDFP